MFQHTRFGLAALLLTVSAAALAARARADDPPPKVAPAVDTSPDKMYSLTLSEGKLSVGKVTIKKVKVTTKEGETVEQEVMEIAPLYARKKEKYLAAKFLPDAKGDDAAIIAVSEKFIYVLDAAEGDIKVGIKPGLADVKKAEIVFDGKVVKVLIERDVYRFDSKTGKELND